ncbi:MAG: T9SS C-terminal target domain-containing protein, partial [Balneolaceae bacterium]
ITDLELHNRHLYLVDLETGESVALSDNLSYEFTVNEAFKAPTDPFAMLSDDPRKTSVDSYRFIITSKQPNRVETVDLPEEITLRQNFPNPFNPSTVISYDLPEQTHVTLQVYDIMGRYITTLVNDQVPAGQHQVTFDAADLSSGTYIYRLQAGSVIQSRSLTLIK